MQVLFFNKHIKTIVSVFFLVFCFLILSNVAFAGESIIKERNTGEFMEITTSSNKKYVLTKKEYEDFRTHETLPSEQALKINAANLNYNEIMGSTKPTVKPAISQATYDAGIKAADEYVANNATTYGKLCGTDGCDYTLMAPIGSLLGNSDGKYIIKKSDAQKGLCPLLNSWFRIGIALAGMLAVVMIVLGGFQYATTDSLFDKEEGKGKIQNALWGLLLALTTWLVVSTINPALADCTINANAVQLSQQSTSIINSAYSIAYGVLSAYDQAADQGAIDAKYKAITDNWTEDDQKALDRGEQSAKDKWSGIQTQLDTLNNSFVSKGGSYSGGSTNRDQAWGSPDATNMNGKAVSGRQTYFSPNEKNTDSNTQAGNGAMGKLVEGTSGGKNALGQDLGTGDVVGSAASVYYPAGTLVEVNGIKYVVDDNNLNKTGDGTYVAKNQNLTNNYTVDIFTRNNTYVNTGSDTKRTMKVLYVPTTKVTSASQIADIRNNPSKYVGK